MLKIGLIGSTGKMGTAVIQSAYKMQDTFSIEGSFSTKNNINELENVFYA